MFLCMAMQLLINCVFMVATMYSSMTCLPSIYRRKLQAKLKEAEESLSTTETKFSSLDKTRQRLSNEVEDLNHTLENVSTLQSIVTL